MVTFPLCRLRGISMNVPVCFVSFRNSPQPPFANQGAKLLLCIKSSQRLYLTEQVSGSSDFANFDHKTAMNEPCHQSQPVIPQRDPWSQARARCLLRNVRASPDSYAEQELHPPTSFGVSRIRPLQLELNFNFTISTKGL